MGIYFCQEKEKYRLEKLEFFFESQDGHCIMTECYLLYRYISLGKGERGHNPP